MDIVKQVVFPFKDADKFVTRKPISYEFNLTNPKTVVHIQTEVVGFYQSDMTCRLYLLGADGFTSEYYLGVQETGSCMINVAVPSGRYHLQLQPTTGTNISYTVEASVGTSDGNDGFMEALNVITTTPRTGVLEPNDLYDWYKFTVEHSMTATVDVTGTALVDCIIYMPPGVDQFGFAGPECGKPYDYVSGNVYTIGVGRGATDPQKTVTYTIKWQ